MLRSSIQSYVLETVGEPGETTRIAASDTAQSLSQNVIVKDGRNAIAILVTCEENDIRFALGGATPTQGASAVGHVLAVGESIRLASPEAVTTFKFINKTNGQNGVIQVTPEF